ncbi:MAG TPA: c-type cytochrome [Pseudobdellovibrionaceae bacterium]|jgi:cytochrome c oxidase subunit 2
MSPALKLEGKLFALAFFFLAFCFGMTVYAVYKYGLDVPTCLTSAEPFTKGQVIVRAPDHYEIHYVAKMWEFDPAVVNVRTGSTLDIYLNSIDVTHGFQIPGTNANLMAVPGAVNYVKLFLKNPGQYNVVCHEYCGLSHHNMIGVINVSDNPLPNNQGVPEALTSQAEAEGLKLLQVKACVGCHSTDGSPRVGPTFKGIFGRTVMLDDGVTIKVDEAYLIESIRQPQVKVVQGYQPLMPLIPLSDQEIQVIIQYLRWL